MLRRLFLVFFAANCLFAQSAPAPAPAPTPAPQQTPPAKTPQSDAQSKISVNSDLVVLPVTVKDQHGDLVPDLSQSDFRIFDDDVEQSIDVFTEEAFPLSLVVLIDDDLKSKDAAQMAPTLRAITAGISANDEALVARFDIDFYPGDQFTIRPRQTLVRPQEPPKHAPSLPKPAPSPTSAAISMVALAR